MVHPLTAPTRIALLVLLLLALLAGGLASASAQARRRRTGRALASDGRVVVSFCTAPWRLAGAARMVRSLLAQRLPRERMVIVATLPSTFQGRPCDWSELPGEFLGIELIREVADLGPATKVAYAGRRWPDLPVVSVDDDRIYGPEVVSSLLGAHLRNPGVVWTHDARAILGQASTGGASLLEARCLTPGCSDRALLMGYAGVVYPAGFFVRPGVFRELQAFAAGPCRLCDDVTLSWLARSRGVPVRALAAVPPWFLDPPLGSRAAGPMDDSALHAADRTELARFARETARRERYTPAARLLLEWHILVGRLGHLNGNSRRYPACVASLPRPADVFLEGRLRLPQ